MPDFPRFSSANPSPTNRNRYGVPCCRMTSQRRALQFLLVLLVRCLGRCKKSGGAWFSWTLSITGLFTSKRQPVSFLHRLNRNFQHVIARLLSCQPLKQQPRRG